MKTAPATLPDHEGFSRTVIVPIVGDYTLCDGHHDEWELGLTFRHTIDPVHSVIMIRATRDEDDGPVHWRSDVYGNTDEDEPSYDLIRHSNGNDVSDLFEIIRALGPEVAHWLADTGFLTTEELLKIYGGSAIELAKALSAHGHWA